MKNLAYLFIVGTFVLTACKKDEVIKPVPPTPIDGEIDLGSIKVGQQSQYIAYDHMCDGEYGIPVFSGDTLNLEVVRVDGVTHFSESFTPHSPSYTGADPVLYEVVDMGSYLSIPDRASSLLFFFFESDQLWKNKPIETELQFDGCVMKYPNGDPFTGDEMGHIDDLEIGPFNITDQRVVSCEPFFELDAFLAYDNRLRASHTVSYGGIVGPYAHGWVLIE